MSRGHGRRSLFGIGAAGGAALLLAATEAGQAKAEELDGALLAACARFQRAEAERRRRESLFSEAEKSFGPRSQQAAAAAAFLDDHDDDYEAAAADLTEYPVRTPEGLRALAGCVFAFYTPDGPAHHDIVGTALWSVVCAAAGQSNPWKEGA